MTAMTTSCSNALVLQKHGPSHGIDIFTNIFAGMFYMQIGGFDPKQKLGTSLKTKF